MRILMILFTLFAFINAEAQTVKYFRQLAYNHVSPHMEIKGIHEIDAMTAEKASHYIFKYDKNGRLTTIINHHFEHERKHPLTHPNVHRLEISYEKDKEVRIFFDKLERRMANLRGVYKEEYTLKNGFKTALSFFDLENQPMESNWKIAAYQWTKQKNRVIEKRFNLAGEEAPVSTYFNFQRTAIEYDKRGFPSAHYNLDENLNVVDSDFGIAVYKDVYDEKGNHIEWCYYDAKGDLAHTKQEYAVAKKFYNQEGKNISTKYFDRSNTFLREREMKGDILKFASLTTKDSTEIKRKALGYIKALRELNPELMKEVMHEKLAKRTQGYDRKIRKEIPRETTYDQMIKFADGWNNAGDKFPEHPTEKAIILDAYHFMASVKLVSDNWVEYLHLIKLDGEWKIINMLWQHKDTSRYPH